MGIYEDIQKSIKRQEAVAESFFSNQKTSDLIKNIESDIEKGGKAAIGEVRVWNGKKMRKQPNGKWIEERGQYKKDKYGKNIVDEFNGIPKKDLESAMYSFAMIKNESGRLNSESDHVRRNAENITKKSESDLDKLQKKYNIKREELKSSVDGYRVEVYGKEWEDKLKSGKDI